MEAAVLFYPEHFSGNTGFIEPVADAKSRSQQRE
jgi:hypothetical protein